MKSYYNYIICKDTLTHVSRACLIGPCVVVLRCVINMHVVYHIPLLKKGNSTFNSLFNYKYFYVFNKCINLHFIILFSNAKDK